MNKKILVIILVSIISLIGCSKPKIDATSEETMKTSIEKVRKSLPENKKTTFDESLQIIAFSGIDFKDIFAAGTSGLNLTEAKVKQSLAGKTGEEIILQAENIKKEREAKEKEQALAEIKELIEKQTKAQNAKSELAKFQVTRSRFYKKQQEYLGEKPIIELTVKNGTQHPISRAYFSGTLASPGRSIPWLKEDFNYSISGGLESGETASWSLSPNMFSGWGQIKIPSDAIFTVEVEQLDGPKGETLFSTKGFSDEDSKRLSELKQRYAQ